jgi:hypothetical protein
VAGVRVLEEPEWRRRSQAYRDRMGRYTAPHRERRRRGERHPVLDFLFEYYSFRPGRLERWHPGPGVRLTGDVAEFLAVPGYTGGSGCAWFDPAGLPAARRESARFVARLLAAISGREPRLGCFGLHEWAMLYRHEQARHEQLPLRLGRAGTDEVVERHALRCTHHDAFRFFTPAARPRNAGTPTRAGQLDMEQPGCLHVSMDLYKWAYKLSPGVPAELVGDCFELAVRARELDMRASPYDLTALGYSPVPIETPEGRARYVREQAALAEAAAPLRTRLREVAEQLAADPVPVS